VTLASKRPTTRIVFITSENYDGKFTGNAFSCGDGIVGADCVCNGLAAAEGLGMNFKAWLSTSAGGPASEESTFFPSPTPYVRVNGVMVAANWDDLIDGAILHPIEVDEKGGLLPFYCFEQAPPE